MTKHSHLPGRSRKCDTAKHRRRVKKQRENRAIRQQRQVGPPEVRTPEPPAVICPLCKQPITVDDAIGNMKTIMLNRERVQVHKTCPTEVKK